MKTFIYDSELVNTMLTPNLPDQRIMVFTILVNTCLLMHLFYMLCVYKKMIINGIFYCIFYKLITRTPDLWVINLTILGRGTIEHPIHLHSLSAEDYAFFQFFFTKLYGHRGGDDEFSSSLSVPPDVTQQFWRRLIQQL